MNLYPILLLAINKSRSWLQFLVSNTAWLVLIIIGLASWHFWLNGYFHLIQASLQNTELSGDQVRELLNQTKSIGTNILLVAPLLLIVWRILWPISIHNLDQKKQPQTRSYLLTSLGFDLLKLVLITIVGLIINRTVHTNILTASIILLIGILLLSICFHHQIAFTLGANSFKSTIGSWFRHLDSIMFLHAIDIALSLVSFCLLGLILASNLYMPSIIAVLLTLMISLLIGKLWLIRKGLWTYAITEMTNSTQS
jgi:hypothetical protein